MGRWWRSAAPSASCSSSGCARAGCAPRRCWRVTFVALFLGYWLSGAGLDFLKPRNWDDLFSGLGTGLQALGTVRLPYVSADPWPGIVLELLGAQLLILAGLLTFWPRTPSGAETRLPLTPPDRGYPIVSLAVLLVVIASPVVSLGGTGSRPLLLGLVLAGLTVCFLWLERLPFRPGMGVAGLLALALIGALPIAALADRGEPWFDYRSFAESLGPDDPIRFSWEQSYGPISWPRDGNEVMRVVSASPLYWKARNLDVFNGQSWEPRTEPVNGFSTGPFDADVPADWEENKAFTETIDVSVRRMRIQDVIGAGTTLEVRDSSRDVQPGLSPGTYDAPTGLRRGDSYTAEVFVPRPDQEQMAQSTSGAEERQRGQRMLLVPFRPGETAPPSQGNITGERIDPSTVTESLVRFGAWDGSDGSAAGYPTLRRSEFDVEAVMERSVYARTWELVQKLKRDKDTAMDYVRAVDEYLSGPEFRYVERPTQPPAGLAPLDFFINESHEGYCQHYAGAMALMLRMGGIPARVATGFSPGGYSDRKKAWIVRDTDAHAWVEIWFDEYGWVTVDPTPSATPARSLVAALAPDLDSTSAGRAGRHRRRRRRQRRRVAPQRPPGAADRRRRRARRRGRRGRHALVAVRPRRDRGDRRGARDRALPAPPARPDADGPRDRRGRGRDAPGRAAGHDRDDAHTARAPARLALARGLGVPAGARRRALRARPGTALEVRPARAAPGAGPGARLRRPGTRAVGAAAADRAGPAAAALTLARGRHPRPCLSRAVTVSKFLALHLRHAPERIGLELDEAGWVDVDELLRAAEAAGFPITRAELDVAVAEPVKRRYAYDESGTRVRAVQGHSVAVSLGYEPSAPPAELFHGTVERFLERILAEGLRPMDRRHVHLSPDVATAQTVGMRRGQARDPARGRRCDGRRRRGVLPRRQRRLAGGGGPAFGAVASQGPLKNSGTPPAARPRRLAPPTLLTWQSHASRARAARAHWRPHHMRRAAHSSTNPMP